MCEKETMQEDEAHMRAPNMKSGPAVEMMRVGDTSGCGKLL